MKRTIIQKLRQWRLARGRRPIILRGARQVGKTHVIEQFGDEFDNFAMINLEKQQSAIDVFSKDLDVVRIVRDLEFIVNQKIIPGKTLLFIDEIQEAPKAITALRYFYEDMPDLHVIAAGSLLDFAIESVGVPVGRVSFMYMYPMTFVEYLIAMGEEITVRAILEHEPFTATSDTLHKKCLSLVGEYMAIGGMPAVVKEWRDNRDVDMCGDIQSLIIESYQQDFDKYAEKHQIKYVTQIFNNIPLQLSKSFQFSKVPGGYRKRELSPCYDLLTKARVIQSVLHSHGHGLPLGGQADINTFKSIFLDVALAQRLLGYHPKNWFLYPEEELINKGEITESFIGQEILAYASPVENQQLYYWLRHSKSSTAEVDYIIDVDGKVVPLEVKSAKGTTLKSMHIFLDEHPQSPYGVRLSTHNYSDHSRIHSYPIYAVIKFMLQRDPKLRNLVESLFITNA